MFSHAQKKILEHNLVADLMGLTKIIWLNRVKAPKPWRKFLTSHLISPSIGWKSFPIKANIGPFARCCVPQAPSTHLRDNLVHTSFYLSEETLTGQHCFFSELYIRNSIQTKIFIQPDTASSFMRRSWSRSKGNRYSITSAINPLVAKALDHEKQKHSSSRNISAPSACSWIGTNMDLSTVGSSSTGWFFQGSKPSTWRQNFATSSLDIFPNMIDSKQTEALHVAKACSISCGSNMLRAVFTSLTPFTLQGAIIWTKGRCETLRVLQCWKTNWFGGSLCSPKPMPSGLWRFCRAVP